MAVSKLELRIAALEESFERRMAAFEAEIANLKPQQTMGNHTGDDWLHSIYGSFVNDPDYNKAMELGRKYRESQWPDYMKKPVRSKKKSSPNNR